jgi:hypothetical protein
MGAFAGRKAWRARGLLIGKARIIVRNFGGRVKLKKALYPAHVLYPSHAV